MRIMKATFGVFLALLLVSAVMAAGGSKQAEPSAPEMTPEQKANQHYNRGLGYRDAAWKAEKKLAKETDPKKQAKLEKKIHRSFESAVAEQLEATNLNPRFHQAYSSLGYAYRRLGDFDSALRAYDAALALEPSYAEAIEYRGQAYLGLGRIDEAKQAYVSLFGKDPEKAATLLAAMKTWTEQRRAEPAGVPGDTIESLDAWIRERDEIARQAGQASAGNGGW